MGGRGSSWDNGRMALDERMIYDDESRGGRSKKIPAAEFQTISGNRVSMEATLKRVEPLIASHTYETGLIIDEQGFVLAAYRGDRSSVNFGADGAKLYGNTMTHNHPSDIAVFSVADIASTGAAGGIRARATTKTRGTAVMEKASNNPDWAGLAAEYKKWLKPGRMVYQAQDWLRDHAGDYGLRFYLER